MFKRIMVPSALMADDEPALAIAVQIAEQNEAVISLLHVIETIADASFSEFEKFYLKLERQSQRDMATLIRQYQDRPIQINREIRYGNRAQEILKFSVDHGIDLIVMNSHRIDPENPSEGWGTISYKVGILSQCPVMLVK